MVELVVARPEGAKAVVMVEAATAEAATAAEDSVVVGWVVGWAGGGWVEAPAVGSAEVAQVAAQAVGSVAEGMAAEMEVGSGAGAMVVVVAVAGVG